MTEHKIYTVSQLTAEIRHLLEENFSFVWISGEISNFRIPASGHYYFTLKDDRARLDGVMFRGQNRKLKFIPEDGMRITGLGRISVYEPRGSYQIILEYMEPKGIGELQVAFEQLKMRLESEGLFDPVHKKEIPFLPEKIALVTSKTGAVLHDILQVTGRRYPDIPIEIVPVRVQGEGAVEEICAALALINQEKDADLIILARGGGSLEDLQAFNAEKTARAVFASEIPVISAVGHETDFSIADFAADLRAPTPSAAAEMAVPLKAELIRACDALRQNLQEGMRRYLRERRQALLMLGRRIIHPRRKTDDFRLRLDDYHQRIKKAAARILSHRREQVRWLRDRLLRKNPAGICREQRERLEVLRSRLLLHIRYTNTQKNAACRELKARLGNLNPSAVLERGYSIAFTVPQRIIVREAAALSPGQKLEVRVAKGQLHCRVEGVSNGSKENI